MLIQQDNLSSLVSKVAQMKCPVYMALYLIQKFELFFFAQLWSAAAVRGGSRADY